MDNPLSSSVDIVDFLATTDLFKGLDRSALEDLESKLKWVQLKSGETLIAQSTIEDSLYILVHGRLRISAVIEGRTRVLGEIGRGEPVGEIGLLTGEARRATVQAIRDCELLQFPREQFLLLIQKYPQAITGVARNVVERIQHAFQNKPLRNPLYTIAIVPASEDVPLERFTHMLSESLEKLEPTLLLSSKMIDQRLGEGAAQTLPSDPRNRQLMTWLAEQENHYRWIIYQADKQPTPWTMRCIRQADRILIVGMADNKVNLQKLNEQILRKADSLNLAKRELILLHPPFTNQPVYTKHWLVSGVVSGHSHVRLDVPADIERLTRKLTGRSIGLVLGGGGARGFAHIGFIRLFMEAGIPFDFVGGTSIGALFSAQYALGWDYQMIMERTEEAFFHSGSLLDYTFPIVSLVSGRKTQKALDTLFGEIDIEDLWLDFFCVSANLTRAETIIHQNSSLWKAVRASTSLPGVFPPVYHEGNLLVDGGLFNILPMDIMAERCEGGRIVSIDVSSEIDLTPQEEFAAAVSGWSLLWNRINPIRKKISIPYIFNVLLRATDLGGYSKKKQLIEAGLSDIYIRPPINQFGTLEFNSFAKIVDVGYQHGLQHIDQWKAKLGL